MHLNKACPKNNHSLPNIDTLFDKSSGYIVLSFMDIHSGYNQIPLNTKHKENIPFILEFGTFCFNIMLFGLKNVGVTFQRLMDKVFKNQADPNVEVYVDHILEKSIKEEDHPRDLEENIQ